MSRVRWFATVFVQRRPNLAVTMPGWGGGDAARQPHQHTGIVDDAVFELMLEPKNWGEMSFQ